jgi:hypothetical protein
MAVTRETMNYASVVFVGFSLISAAWYWVWGYRNYAGPPTEERANSVVHVHGL